MEKNSESYRRLLSDTKSFNKNLFEARRHRSPFIDSHTGIAQVDCSLWHLERERSRKDDNDATSTVYRYPSQRWRKCRRDYLSRLDSFSSDGHSNNYIDSIEKSIPFHRYIERPSNEADSVCAGAQNALSTGYLFKYSTGTSHMHHQGPPRTDSTGSHSNMDSDSRDLSSTTSQSHDSPRRTPSEHEDHVLCDHLESHFSEPKCHELITQSLKHPKEKKCIQFEIDGEPIMPNCLDEDIQILRDRQTREAIRLQSRMSRKRNAGQSLIKTSDCSNVLARDNSHDNIRQSEKEEGYPDGQFNEVVSDHKDSGADNEPKANSWNLNKRPHVCTICEQSYKTRPGLSYHFIHIHNMTLPKNPQRRKVGTTRAGGESNSKKSRPVSKFRQNPEKKTRVLRNSKLEDPPEAPESDDPRNSMTVQSKVLAECDSKEESLSDQTDILSTGSQETDILSNNSDNCAESNGTHVTEMENTDRSEHTIHSDGKALHPDAKHTAEVDACPKVKNETIRSDHGEIKKAHPNHFCDFCHGTSERNRRTRLPERLISCTSCGSSGHPTCLRFSENICLSIEKYDWQCTDCKTCSFCNKADNEGQLLFCDDCDRSYHTYCLEPPLNEPPEGNWSCNLCLIEYHQGQ